MSTLTNTQDEPLLTFEQEQRKNFVDGLRQLANFFEAHPEVPQPSMYGQKSFYGYQNEKDPDYVKGQLAIVGKAIAKHFGRADKITSEGWVGFKIVIGGIPVEFESLRENVCQRVQTGTETKVENVAVDLKGLSDKELLAKIRSGEIDVNAYEKKEVEKPVFAFKCGSILAD